MKDMEIIQAGAFEEIEGIPVYYFKKVTSTMDVADKFLNNGKAGIVVADEQEKGRGRYGKRWFSPSGGLYFSWILKEEQLYPLYLSEIISLTLVETMRHFGIYCRIKLPNDIIVYGKKIAGVLIWKKGTFYIAGIGINVNNPVEDKDSQIAMKDILKKEIDRKEVMKQFISTFREVKRKFYTNPDSSLILWGEYLIK